MKSLSVTILMKAMEQDFPMVLLIRLHKKVVVSECLDEALACDYFSGSVDPGGYLNFNVSHKPKREVFENVPVELMNVTHLQRFRTLDMCDTLLLSFADHPNHGMCGMEVKRPLSSENLVQDRATGNKSRFNIRIRQLAVLFSYTEAKSSGDAANDFKSR